MRCYIRVVEPALPLLYISPLPSTSQADLKRAVVDVWENGTRRSVEWLR